MILVLILTKLELHRTHYHILCVLSNVTGLYMEMMQLLADLGNVWWVMMTHLPLSEHVVTAAILTMVALLRRDR